MNIKIIDSKDTIFFKKQLLKLHEFDCFVQKADDKTKQIYGMKIDFYDNNVIIKKNLVFL